MKINGLNHILTVNKCLKFGKLLLSTVKGGYGTDFVVELTEEEELLICNVKGTEAGEAIYNCLKSALGLKVPLRCTYKDRIFTSFAG